MSMRNLVYGLDFVFLLMVLGCAVFKCMVDKREWERKRSLKKQGRPWRTTSRSRRTSRRLSLYFTLLWAGICFCRLMERNYDFRNFWFFFGLVSLAAAAIQFDTQRVQNFLRSRFFSPDPQSELHLSN